MKAGKTVLIVARQGPLRDSLNVLLESIPQVKVICNSSNGQFALEKLAGIAPDLVLLVTDLKDNGVLDTVKQIKKSWPQIKSLVLADTPRQQEAANAYGADRAFLKGFSGSQLIAEVRALISNQNHEKKEKEQ